MTPSLLKRYFESKHEYLVKKGLDYFKCLLDDLKSSKNTIK